MLKQLMCKVRRRHHSVEFLSEPQIQQLQRVDRADHTYPAVPELVGEQGDQIENKYILRLPDSIVLSPGVWHVLVSQTEAEAKRFRASLG